MLPSATGGRASRKEQLFPTTNRLLQPTELRAAPAIHRLVVSRLRSKHRINTEKVLKRQRLAPRRGRSILPRMGDLSSRAIRHVSRLSLGEQRDLLQDLTAPAIIRADAIRQFRERPDGQRMAEVLMDLEADETLRLHVVDALRRSLASPGGQPEE